MHATSLHKSPLETASVLIAMVVHSPCASCYVFGQFDNCSIIIHHFTGISVEGAQTFKFGGSAYYLIKISSPLVKEGGLSITSLPRIGQCFIKETAHTVTLSSQLYYLGQPAKGVWQHVAFLIIVR
jgi:hypothetical protein